MAMKLGRPPLTAAQKRQRLPGRFWAKVNKGDGPSACWIWQGAKDRRGYGKVEVDGRFRTASRVAWILIHGEVPENYFVCHHCDVPACVNPAHLFIGTGSDNMRDMVKKGRHASASRPGWNSGESNGRAKLRGTQAMVIRARHRAGESSIKLADEYGVSKSLVLQISRGEVWGT